MFMATPTMQLMVADFALALTQPAARESGYATVTYPARVSGGASVTVAASEDRQGGRCWRWWLAQEGGRRVLSSLWRSELSATLASMPVEVVDVISQDVWARHDAAPPRPAVPARTAPPKKAANAKPRTFGG